MAASARALALLLALLARPDLAAAQAPGYPHGGGSCTSEDDCSLGGECTASACACDPWWTGSNCEYLNLQRPRLDDQAGLCHKGFASYYSWGGRSAFSPADNKYHLVASFMCRHATLASWTTVSSSAHFVSDTPDGAYVWADSSCEADICTPVVIPWSHNTVVAQNGDGMSPSIIVAHIGDGVVDPSKWAPCFNKSDVHDSDGATGDAAAAAWPHPSYGSANEDGALLRRSDPSDTCYFETADHWDGPWSRALNNSGVVINTTGSWSKDGFVGNPAPFVFANGSVFLYFTATTCPPGSGNKAPPCIAMARSDSFLGPYTMEAAPRPITYPESEDPSVFRDKRGNFHLFTNVNTYHARCAQGVPCGGHAWSRDGLVFSNLTIGAFGPVITFKNGSQWKNAYVERPLVTMAADGITPLAFHVGMGRSAYEDSCNWVQLFCTDGTDLTCGPTRFAPTQPARNVTLRNGGLCLVIANASSFPCSGEGTSAGCPVVMGACEDASALWQLQAETGFVVSSTVVGADGGAIGLDVDCDSAAPHTIVKALASGLNAASIGADGRFSVLSGAACLNTGQGPAVPPCGPKTELWLPTQIQVAASCDDVSAQGWSVVPVSDAT